MKAVCRLSGESFEVSAADICQLEKYGPIIDGKKYGLPLPKLSPLERRRRRLSFRNERRLYHRKCSLTGKELISVYSPEKTFPVYGQSEWWSDSWDATAYGRDFNSSKSFFEQFAALQKVVPRVALINSNSFNCDYTNLAADNKNCYILIESSNNQDCHYSYWMQRCRDCLDCSFDYDCELCYELTDSFNCYNTHFSQGCKSCHDCAFLQDCQSCSNCFGCINLRNKSYCLFNRQCSKDEYFQQLKDYSLSSYRGILKAKREAQQLFQNEIRRHANVFRAENCSGDYISNSKDCHSCFHAFEAQDCRYGVHVWRNSKDNMDVDTCGRDAELNYECINTGISAYNNLFCNQCWSTSDLLYCDMCQSSRNCFGCIGLRNKSYCILNKQYSRSEYEAKVAQIIELMRVTGEWGEFFPFELSPYGYNETSAAECYPLTQIQALELGCKWKEEDRSSGYKGRVYEIPDLVSDLDDDVTRAILTCVETAKPYKLISQELAFYRKLSIAPPRVAPECRHQTRMSLRHPMILHQRSCDVCQTIVSSPYAPSSSQRIACERCYEAAVG